MYCKHYKCYPHSQIGLLLFSEISKILQKNENDRILIKLGRHLLWFIKQTLCQAGSLYLKNPGSESILNFRLFGTCVIFRRE